MLYEACKNNQIQLIDELLQTNLPEEDIQEALAEVICNDNDEQFQLFLKHHVPLHKPFTQKESIFFENMTPLQGALKMTILSNKSKILTSMLYCPVELNVNYVISNHYDPPYDFTGFTAIAMAAAYPFAMKAISYIEQLIAKHGDIRANQNIALAVALENEMSSPFKFISDFLHRRGATLDINTAQNTVIKYLRDGTLAQIKKFLTFNLSIDYDNPLHVQAIISNTHAQVLGYFFDNGLQQETVLQNRLLMNKAYKSLIEALRTNTPIYRLELAVLNLMISNLQVDNLCSILDALLARGNVQFQSITTSIMLNGIPSLFQILDECSNIYLVGNFSEKVNKIKSHYLSKGLTPEMKDYFLKEDSDENYLSLFKNKDLMAACEKFTIFQSLNDSKRFVAAFRLFHENKKFINKSTYLAMFEICKRVGHCLGNSNPINLKIRGSNLCFLPNGHVTSTALHYVMEYIECYQQVKPSLSFKSILESMQVSFKLMNTASNTFIWGAEKQLYEQYKQDKMVFIPCGWSGHTFSIVLYKNFLVICNRGENRKYTSTAIYQLKNPSKISAEIIYNLLIGDNDPNFVLENIMTLTAESNLIAEYHLKDQNHGNCAFANLKSIIELMLMLLSLPDKLELKALKEYVIANKQSARERYKDFTSFIRDTIVDEIIANMDASIGNALMVQFYAQLLANIATEKFKPGAETLKSKADMSRIAKLYQYATPSIKYYLHLNQEYMKIRQIHAQLPHLKLLNPRLTKPVAHTPAINRNRRASYPSILRQK